MSRQTPVAGQSEQRWNILLLGIFGFLLVVGYAAAFNKALPSLYIWVSGVFALFLLGVSVPYLNLRNKHVDRRIPTEAVAGQAAELEVTITNRSWLPAFVIQLSDYLAFSTTPRVVLGTLSYLPRRGSVTFTTHLTCERRGVWSIGPAMLESSFPLDLIRRGVPCDDPPTLITVLPRTHEVKQLALAGSSREQRYADLPSPLGHGDELVRGLREYRPGDPIKHLNWRAFAKSGVLTVQEYDPVTAGRIRLVLDLDGGLDDGATWSIQEAQISIAASIALYACQHGIAFEIQHGTAHPDLLPDQLAPHDLLRWFAELPRESSTPYASTLGHATEATHPGESVFVFARADAATLAPAIEALQAASQYVTLIAFDPASFGLPASNGPVLTGTAAKSICVTAETRLEDVFDELAP